MNYNFIYDSERGKLFFVRPDESLMEITESANVEQEFIEVYQAINNLREETTSKEQFYSAFPVETASGAIVSITDGADNIPLKSCFVTMLPIQDLHGQDSPYPAGGGKNKFQTTATTQTVNGKTFTVNSDGSVSLSGTATASIGSYMVGEVTLPAGTYKVNGVSGGAVNGVRCTVSNMSKTPLEVITTLYAYKDVEFELTEGSNIRLTIIVPNGDTTALTIYPMIRLASVTDNTFAPYSNICPITGYDSGTVWGTGRNLLNPDYSAYTTGSSYLFMNDVVPKGQTARMTLVDRDTAVDISGCYMGFQKGLTQESATPPTEFKWAISNGNLTVETSNISGQSHIACDGIFIYPKDETTFNKLFSRYYIMVELGTDAHDYAPYTGASYHSDFPSTVYGGDWAVTEGEIAETYGMVDLGTLTWTYVTNDGEPYYYAIISNKKVNDLNMVCSAYKTASGSGTNYMHDMEIGASSSNTRIFVKDSRYTDAVAFKTAVSGVQLCYKTATPQLLSVDSHTITTLLGDNNIWSDAGNVSVTYRADIQKYIDGQ